MTYPEVLHYGPDVAEPEHPVEVWEPVRGAILASGLPNVEVVDGDMRYRNDENGRPWKRVLHGEAS